MLLIIAQRRVASTDEERLLNLGGESGIINSNRSGVDFYRDVLGFAFDGFANFEGRPYYAEMVAGGVKFGLHEPTSTGQENKVGQQRLYFRVTDLPAHRSRVLARGGEAGEIKVTGWMDMFIVNDPDGNEIVFAATDPARHSSNPWNTRMPAKIQDKDR